MFNVCFLKWQAKRTVTWTQIDSLGQVSAPSIPSISHHSGYSLCTRPQLVPFCATIWTNSNLLERFVFQGGFAVSLHMACCQSWRSLTLAILARCELDRISLFLSSRDGICKTVRLARMAVCSESDNRLGRLRSSLQACHSFYLLGRKVPRIKTAAPLLRDLAVARIADIVDVRDRTAFLQIITDGCNELTYDAQFVSVLCKSFSDLFGHLVQSGLAFASHNSKRQRHPRRNEHPRLHPQEEAVTAAAASVVQPPYVMNEGAWASEMTMPSSQWMPEVAGSSWWTHGLETCWYAQAGNQWLTDSELQWQYVMNEGAWASEMTMLSFQWMPEAACSSWWTYGFETCAWEDGLYIQTRTVHHIYV